MQQIPQDLLVVGKIGSVFGVKGWVKVHSYTEPMDNFSKYKSCYVNRNGQWQALTFDTVQRQGKGLVAHIEGIDQREEARDYGGCEVAVSPSALKRLPAGEYYWHQLVGLQVVTEAGDSEQLLGEVSHLLETGANDVLVVQACNGSIDERERLIPYVPGQYVLDIDLDAGRIRVDWDSEF